MTSFELSNCSRYTDCIIFFRILILLIVMLSTNCKLTHFENQSNLLKI